MALSEEEIALMIAIAEGWKPTITIGTTTLSGYNDAQGVCFMSLPQLEGSQLHFSSSINSGVTAIMEIEGEEFSLVDGESYTSTASSNFDIVFKFVGEGDILGSLTFTAYETIDASLPPQSALLYFASSTSVKSLNLGGPYNVYGSTGEVTGIVSGVFDHASNLYLGTD